MDLKSKQICRFCLTTNRPLTNIYKAEIREVPLSLQIVVSVGIEVFPSDKMPTTICEYCISIMDFLYRFKQMCREADGALRVVHSSEIWPMALDIPQFPEDAPFAIVEKLEIPVDDPGQVVEILESDLFIEDSQPVSTLEELEIKNKDESSITISLPMEELKKPTMSPLKRLKSHIKSKATGVPSSSLSAPKETRVLSRIKNEPKVLNQIPSKGQKTKVPQFMRNKNGNVDILMEEKPDLLQTDVFPCPHCDRSFPLQQLLEIHEQNHTRERESACEVCDKKFFTKYDLAKHMAVHTQERPHVCVVCKKSFSRSTLLHRHQKTHIDEPRLECKDCDRFFFSQEEMDVHAVKHQKPRNFKCSYCQKSFAFKQGLERHETVHLESQPFPCTYCEASFNTRNKLLRHLHEHAGDRPFPCKYCNKSYLLSHHLSRHIRSHAVLENVSVSFKCNCCPEVFKQMDDLVDHMKQHESTSDPTCPLCHELFESSKDCQAHIHLHLDGDQFACEFCDLIFLDEVSLQEHSINDHAAENRVYELEMEKSVKKKMKNPNEDNSELDMELIAAPPAKTIPAKNVYGNKAKKAAVVEKIEYIPVNFKAEKTEKDHSAETKKRPRESVEVPEHSKITNILKSLPRTVSVKKFKVTPPQTSQPNKDVDNSKSPPDRLMW